VWLAPFFCLILRRFGMEGCKHINEDGSSALVIDKLNLTMEEPKKHNAICCLCGKTFVLKVFPYDKVEGESDK
jgi:hypothetical protein